MTIQSEFALLALLHCGKVMLLRRIVDSVESLIISNNVFVRNI